MRSSVISIRPCKLSNKYKLIPCNISELCFHQIFFDFIKTWPWWLKSLIENYLRNVNYSFFPLPVAHLFHLSLHPPEIEPLATIRGCWKHSFNKNNNTCLIWKKSICYCYVLIPWFHTEKCSHIYLCIDLTIDSCCILWPVYCEYVPMQN